MSSTIKSYKETLKEVRKNNEQVIASNEKIMHGNAVPAINPILKSTNQTLLNHNKWIDEYINSGTVSSESKNSRAAKEEEPEWMRHYSVLNAWHRADPIRTIIEFANRDCVFNDRTNLSLFFDGAMQSPVFNFDEAEEKGERIYFYDSLLRLVEAAHLVREMYLKNELKLPKPKEALIG